MNINLVTVCGHNTTMLYHMLQHYIDIVNDFFVVVYAHHDRDPVIEEATYILDKFNLKPHKVVIEKPFHWERVTEHYNETKQLKPVDWWIVADDDELQVYSKPISDIIDECEEFGYEFITGGFIDRIGENGTFPKINDDSDIWKEMPNAGFFRYPLSDANPNKVTLMKGKHNVVPGQHYVDFGNNETSWGTSHPLRYPIQKNFTQVHHFKWEYSVLERLKQVSKSKLSEAFSEEYAKMLQEIENRDYQFDISNRRWLFQRVESPNYQEYRYWKKVTKKIVQV